MYEKEVVDQEAKIEKMKAENKDAYDIKKQVFAHNLMCVCDQRKLLNEPIVLCV